MSLSDDISRQKIIKDIAEMILELNGQLEKWQQKRLTKEEYESFVKNIGRRLDYFKLLGWHMWR